MATIACEEESSIDSKRAASASPERQEDIPPQAPREVLKCPRCDSMKTKFCYYNNYSLTQPRHFCKTCRRYWTKGGALRNVPIGGGCRKNKKLKSSSSNSSINISSTSASLDLAGGLKFLQGISSSPAMDFQFGGLNLPRLNLNSPPPSSGVVYNQFSNSFGDIVGSSLPLPAPSFSLDNLSLGFNFSFPPLFKQQSGNNNNVSFGLDGNQELNYGGNNNQDFPWKFQQQNSADLLSGNNDNNISQNKSDVSQASYPPFLDNYQQVQRPQPTQFQNFDISPRTNGFSYAENSRKEGQSGNFASGYFHEETFAPTINPTTSTITSTGANNGNEIGTNWNNGVQAWGNVDQFGELP